MPPSQNRKTLLACFWLLAPVVLGQEKTPLERNDIQQILERLERIEQENRNLAAEVRALREQLSTRAQPQPAPEAQPPLEERAAVQEQRVEEMAQTKVEASQKFPIKLTGTLLFNSFLNGRANGGSQYPTIAALTDNHTTGGASFTQSLIGFLYDGPKIWGGGKVNGSLLLDLSGGSSAPLNHLVRLHVARLSVDWKNQSITVAQDKPIFSPREPDSLAQVAVSPLTGAGNPWLWQPQVRFEQRFAVGEQTGVKAQVGVYQTAEPIPSTGADPSSRPGFEGRFELWRDVGRGARIEIAPGFHASQTHVAGVSIPSRLFSIDWMIRPLPKVQLTGLFFNGKNAGGMGGLRQGFTIRDDVNFIAIRTTGGWSQISYQATSRLGLNLFAGQESYPQQDLLKAMISRNFSYGGNAIFRLAPNWLLSLEASQVRTRYVSRPNRLNNHYDLALAYLF